MNAALAFTLATLVAVTPSLRSAQPALGMAPTYAVFAEPKENQGASRDPMASVNSFGGVARARSSRRPDRIGIIKEGSISSDQIGATAERRYSGDGLSVRATENGARLHCVFQKMQGEVAHEGLWLSSTVTGIMNDRFRVKAVSVGRTGQEPVFLSPTGRVEVIGKLARLIRPGLIEEYTVSMDGVQQDFVVLPSVAVEGRRPRLKRDAMYKKDVDQILLRSIVRSSVTEKPSNLGDTATEDGAAATEDLRELRVELEVSGAKVEQTRSGVRFVLDGSDRKIAYSRLRVIDATGRELPARMEVANRLSSKPETAQAEKAGVRGVSVRLSHPPMLAVLVNDADAVYPVRVDPTFSDANWFSIGGFPGPDNDVFAVVADGSGNLYVSGYFSTIGGIRANSVAKWDGSSWSALGQGMNGYVAALVLSGSDLYAGGQFSLVTNSNGASLAAGSIAKWNGTNWSALGSGVNGWVLTLALAGSDLYAGGYFTLADGNPANNVAKWNGSSWSALGPGLSDSVLALATSGTNLYAGGQFTAAGGSTVNHIARWDGTSWSTLGSGMNDNVFALAWSQTNSSLYVGGQFTAATNNGGVLVPAYYIARWDGNSWSSLGAGANGPVSALTVSGIHLYAGGYFTMAGTNSANHIAVWDGFAWTALGPGITNSGGSIPYVDALAVSPTGLYAGGHFTAAGGSVATNIARWSGSAWSAIGIGLQGDSEPSVVALGVSGGNVYAGGSFTTADGSPANNIAKWDGVSWSPLGFGVNGVVYAVDVSGVSNICAGYFSMATNSDGVGIPVNSIAKWAVTHWLAFGSGVNGAVFALARSGTDLYVGGDFTMAGGILANYVAKWDGGSWSSLGSGLGSGTGFRVEALAVSGGNLYAGGYFTTAGGNPALNIAKWDGVSWSALGSGVNSDVLALAFWNGELYAGGLFTAAGGNPANYIAKWNGNSWSALGSGMDIDVRALAASDSDLYAGGLFSTAGGQTASTIAKWNGSTWSPVGSGPNNVVLSLATSGNNLYAGGVFTRMAGKVSSYVARAVIPFDLTINVSGAGAVIKNPDLVSYFPASTVALTATPAPGWGFLNWSGDAFGSANPLAVLMSTNKTIGATFYQPVLTIRTNGGGLVLTSPTQPTYAYNSSVTLMSVPNLGWGFAGWSGDASGASNPLALLMSTNKTVSANFTSAIPDLIVDNTNATFAGSWTTDAGTAGTGFFASDFRYATSKSLADATATFTPTLPQTGNYDIYVWYPSIAPMSKRCSDAQYFVSWTGGTEIVDVDQRRGSTGAWELIETGKKFPIGPGGFVRLSNLSSDPNRYVAADAVRWVWSTNQAPQPNITSVARAGTNVTMTWLSASNYNYQVEYKTNLNDTAWQDLGLSIVATSNSATNMDAIIVGNQQRFYRVRLIP